MASEMTLKDFVRKVMTNLLNFEINMRNLKFEETLTARGWMEMFLSWSEWETEMHDDYWPEE